MKDGGILPVKLDATVGVSALLFTAETIRDSGRRVVFVGPTPTVGADMAECLLRREMGLLTLGSRANCNIPTQRSC